MDSLRVLHNERIKGFDNINVFSIFSIICPANHQEEEDSQKQQ